MGTDDGTKPWDAPDPSQLRITSSPAPSRDDEGDPKDPAPRKPGSLRPRMEYLGTEFTGDATSAPSPSIKNVTPLWSGGVSRPKGLDDVDAPTRAPYGSTPAASPKALSGYPARPSARPVAAPSGQGAKNDDALIDAPPIPRPRYPYGAPPPAVVDTRAPSPRAAVGEPPDWRDTFDEEPAASDEALDQVGPFARNVGIAIGVVALLVMGLSVGWVVGSAAVDYFFPEEPEDGVTQEQPEPTPPNVPAFRGIHMRAVPSGEADAVDPGVPPSPEAPAKSLLPGRGAPNASAGHTKTQVAPVSTSEVLSVRPRAADPGFRVTEPPAEAADPWPASSLEEDAREATVEDVLPPVDEADLDGPVLPEQDLYEGEEEAESGLR